MQRSGTEAIKAQIQPSKPIREITNITKIYSKNTKRTYCQPSEQLFPKRWPLSNRNRIKNDMNTHKVKRHRNSDTKNRQQRTKQNYRLGTVSNELLGDLNMFYDANLALNNAVVIKETIYLGFQLSITCNVVENSEGFPLVI